MEKDGLQERVVGYLSQALEKATLRALSGHLKGNSSGGSGGLFCWLKGAHIMIIMGLRVMREDGVVNSHWPVGIHIWLTGFLICTFEVVQPAAFQVGVSL